MSKKLNGRYWPSSVFHLMLWRDFIIEMKRSIGVEMLKYVEEIISSGFFRVRIFSRNLASKYSSESSFDSSSDAKYFEIGEYSMVCSNCLMDFTFLMSRVLEPGPPADREMIK